MATTWSEVPEPLLCEPERANIPIQPIYFYHPAYNSFLFFLQRVEFSGGRYGVHFVTALSACQIIANNAVDGYLSTDSTGHERVEAGPDHILFEDRYYFQVPTSRDADRDGQTAIYPVVPRFQDWVFPPNSRVPEIWKIPSSQSTSQCCVISGRSLTEGAHIVPRTERDWFDRNAMRDFQPPGVDTAIDSAGNLVSLDPTLHEMFDDRFWALVPRHGKWSLQALQFGNGLQKQNAFRELVALYHGKKASENIEAPWQYMYARFAYAVFIIVKPWLMAGLPKLIVRLENKERNTTKVEELDIGILRRCYGGGGSRNATSSSSKRPRTEGGGGAEETDDDNDEWMELNNADMTARVIEWTASLPSPAYFMQESRVGLAAMPMVS